jgi:putative transposase
MNKGAYVQYAGQAYRVLHPLNADTAILECPSTHLTVKAKVSSLRPLDEQTRLKPIDDLAEYSDEDIEEAQERLEAIQPLIDLPRRSRADVDKVAKSTGKSAATIYAWIKLWEENRHLAYLVPEKRGVKKGSRRLHKTTEAVIEEAINDVFLIAKGTTVRHLHNDIKARCKTLGLDSPEYSTVRRRVLELSPNTLLRARGRASAARYGREPHPLVYDEANGILDAVQIDHMRANAILVDDVTRQPVDRPWITLAIDVHSTMITGIYITYDAPSYMSAAMCLSHSILGKEEYLAQLGIDESWPVWGAPLAIHTDNAKEFKGKRLEKACSGYGIGLNLRPIKQTHYGGHIERMVGTLKSFIDGIDGTTKRNVADRGDYDSEGEAVMTLQEFERVIVQHIVGEYHRKPKRTDVAPIKKWTDSLLGDEEKPGKGFLPRPENPHRILLDFLPYEERTITSSGVCIDNVEYYHECLTPWIGATTDERESINPDNPRLVKRKFKFRRDPRNVSKIWFFDPSLKEYFDIPYRNPRMPAMSLYDLKEANRKLRLERVPIDEDKIIEARAQVNKQLAESRQKTKSARRKAARAQNRMRQANTINANNLSTAQSTPAGNPKSSSSNFGGLLSGDIQPFEELERA